MNMIDVTIYLYMQDKQHMQRNLTMNVFIFKDKRYYDQFEVRLCQIPLQYCLYKCTTV